MILGPNDIISTFTSRLQDRSVHRIGEVKTLDCEVSDETNVQDSEVKRLMSREWNKCNFGEKPGLTPVRTGMKEGTGPT